MLSQNLLNRYRTNSSLPLWWGFDISSKLSSLNFPLRRTQNNQMICKINLTSPSCTRAKQPSKSRLTIQCVHLHKSMPLISTHRCNYSMCWKPYIEWFIRYWNNSRCFGLHVEENEACFRPIRKKIKVSKYIACGYSRHVCCLVVSEPYISRYFRFYVVWLSCYYYERFTIVFQKSQNLQTSCIKANLSSNRG